MRIHTRPCSCYSISRSGLPHPHCTPSFRHAAASYGHTHILEYLITVGGNVNVTDEDNDTPAVRRGGSRNSEVAHRPWRRNQQIEQRKAFCESSPWNSFTCHSDGPLPFSLPTTSTKNSPKSLPISAHYNPLTKRHQHLSRHHPTSPPNTLRTQPQTS